MKKPTIAIALSSGMRVGFRRLGPGERLPWHDHGSATLCVVLKGSVAEEDARDLRVRTAGDLVFRPVPERHRNHTERSAAELLTLEIEDTAMDMLAAYGLPERTLYARSERAVSLARRARAELVGRYRAAAIELLGLSYELLSTVVRHQVHRSDAPPRWLTRVRQRLASMRERAPTLEDLAGAEGVTPYELSRAFRRHYGVSVGDYLRDKRIALAMKLLSETDMPLADVAQEAGFYDQSHLTNVLKKATGLTPATFRRRPKGE